MKKTVGILGITLLIILLQLTGCGKMFSFVKETEHQETNMDDIRKSTIKEEFREDVSADENVNTKERKLDPAYLMNGACIWEMMDNPAGDDAGSTEQGDIKSSDALAAGMQEIQTSAAGSDGNTADSAAGNSVAIGSTADNKTAGNAASSTSAAGTENVEAFEEPERALTEQEIKKLSWSIRSSDNGFFVSMYYRPEEIDWNQVFYNGAGIGITLSDDLIYAIRVKLTEEEEAKNPQQTESTSEEEGEEEKEEKEPVLVELPGVTAVTLSAVKSFVKSRTGMDYSEMRKPIDWPEISKNVFYFVHGDSNAIRVELLSGTVKGNEYCLYYRRKSRSKSTDPEYVMKVRIEKGRWQFISNLPIDATEPVTMLSIDYFETMEEAKAQNVKGFYDFPKKEEEAASEGEDTSQKTVTPSGKTPKACWAVVTAEYDNTRICFERSYQGDEISRKMLAEGFFIPGEKLGEVRLNKGDKIAVYAGMEWMPEIRIRAVCGNFSGDYSFGGENRLQRITKEGMPMSTYVAGYDLNGEGRGAAYQTEAEMLRFLEGTWVYYDSTFGEYSAVINFDNANHMDIYTYGQDFRISIAKYTRGYVSEDAPPDIMNLRVDDEPTRQKMGTMFYYWKKDFGGYRIKVVQMDGEQILLLSQESSGQDKLFPFFSGADELTEEYAFYRFIGTGDDNTSDPAEENEPEEDDFKG